MAAALFGGIPGAGASMRTAINIKAGGRHRSSGIIHGLFLLAVLLGLSGVVRYIPHAVLAGILISAGLSIIDYRSLSQLSNAPRADVILMLLVVVLTIFTDLITAVGIGMGMPGYQTPAETPDQVSPETLDLAARLVIATVANLATADTGCGDWVEELPSSPIGDER